MVLAFYKYRNFSEKTSFFLLLNDIFKRFLRCCEEESRTYKKGSDRHVTDIYPNLPGFIIT